MQETESTTPQIKTRRKLLAGIGLISLASLWRATGFFTKKKQVISCTPPVEVKTIKVLSQDGKLVEVDMSKIRLIKQKISDQELRDWIKK